MLCSLRELGTAAQRHCDGLQWNHEPGQLDEGNIGNGAQLLLASLLPGSFMTSLNISSNGLSEPKQFQVSGLSSLPLPSAGLLFGTGIVGLGLLARRRRKSTPTGAL